MQQDVKRLHITPFNPDLLPVILGSSLLEAASNISFHTIQTFPDNDYGYLDLPAMDAERVKKKINGAILKGKKVKVEEARPKKRRRIEEPVEDAAAAAAGEVGNKVKRPKKAKAERNVLSGHELPAERKVRRGWTDASQTNSSKSRRSDKGAPQASKYSDKDELIFRTDLPKNRAELAAPRPEKGKERKRGRSHVVHEFAKSTKQPSFLRQDVGLGIQGSRTYIQGQGWVNESGDVVEEEPRRLTRQREAASAASHSKAHRQAPAKTSTPADPSSSESDDESASAVSEAEATQAQQVDLDETSSSGSSSGLDSDAQSVEGEESDDAKRTSSRTTARSDLHGNEVHPLEALFKKPQNPASQDIAKPSLEVSTSFSFFGPQDDDDVGHEPVPPGTPFTSQDIRARGLRSAAPTPDTAYPSRFNSYGSSGLPGDEVDEEDEHDASQEEGVCDSNHGPDPTKHLATTPSRKQSEFEKKFWENRGENNRAWKQRRRTVLKEKRQRENKARRPKNW